MIFSELYGSYYKAMAEIIRVILASGSDSPLKDVRQIVEKHAFAESFPATEAAVKKDVRQIIEKYAFAESFPAIEAAVKEERWQVIRADGTTAVQHPPVIPLTLLERRWLKAISLDPRIRLFEFDFGNLEDVEPLFTPDDYDVFDKYGDGDPYENPEYINNFRLILDAVKERYPLRIGIENRRGGITDLCVIPEYLEYSEKDDKFRLITSGTRWPVTINLGRIVHCRRFDGGRPNRRSRKRSTTRSVILQVTDERNALERVLLHFSHYEKQAERIDETHYRLMIKYDEDDETELVIRILSFGPMVKVISPDSFVELIKDRLIMQKDCGL